MDRNLGPDAPARVLDKVVSWLPPDRGEWGQAIRGELAQLAGFRTRWLFVLGCSRVALWPPPSQAVAAGHVEARRAAALGLLMFGPFLTANVVVANRVEPLFSLIRPGIDTSPREYVLLFGVVFLIPAGAFLALRPMLSNRRFYALNAISAALLVFAFGALVMGIGSEIYRCDILRIPNCD